jgi:Rv2525c-like, glycoside hydrolase-like domain
MLKRLAGLNQGMPMPTRRRSAARPARSVCMLLACLATLAPNAHATDLCVTDPRVEAVDSSAPVTQDFLDQMKAIGVNTIIRYYDHEDETLPGKTLRRGERDAIVMNGLKMGVVFQHRNNKFASFTALRGRQDAARSLVLAAENSQPRGSAIYFGVDGPWRAPHELANIMAYFQEVNTKMAGTGYRVGVYGSGLVCNTLLANGLAELCWLAAPTVWPDFSAWYQTKRWKLVQLPTTQCGGRSVDFNLTNGMEAEYGQFGR